MNPVRFVVDGDPKPWKRAGSNGATRYTPTDMADHQQDVAWAAMAAGVRKIAGPVRLTVVGVFAAPKCGSAAKRAAMIGAPVEKTPDVDNILKQIGDALEGVAYENDKRVGKVEVMKLWGWQGRTIVTVAPWEPTPEEIAAALGEEEAA